MESLTTLLNRIDVFLIVVARISGVFLSTPIFNSRNILGQVKVGFIILISVIVFMVKQPSLGIVPTELFSFVLLFISEVLIGIIIGFSTFLLFSTIYLAGQVIDFHMGFAMSNVVDPLSGVSVQLVGNFKYMIAMLVYLSTSSYHYLFSALFQSYDVIPLLGFKASKSISEYMIGIFGNVLVLAIKLAIPVIGALLVAEIALGIIARTVPQMNVFIVGIPAKLFIGLIMITLILPLYMFFLDELFKINYSDMLNLLKLMH